MIKAADQALKKKDDVIKLSDLALTQCSDLSTRLNTKVEEQNAALSAWYRNPVLVGLIGIVTGGVIVLAVKK